MKLLSCITYECMDIVYKIFWYVNSVSRLCLHLRDVALVVIKLGLEVEALEEPLYVSSPLGIRARIGMICRGCKLEISGILLTVDLRVMDMSEFNVILGMDWLTAHRVVICKTQENSNFWKNGKIAISVKLRKFSRSWMMKRTSPLESSHEI